jgi:hypothetical protein
MADAVPAAVPQNTTRSPVESRSGRITRLQAIRLGQEVEQRALLRRSAHPRADGVAIRVPGSARPGTLPARSQGTSPRDVTPGRGYVAILAAVYAVESGVARAGQRRRPQSTKRAANP